MQSAVNDILWSPSESRQAGTQMARFLKLMQEKNDHSIKHYQDLHRWSITHPDLFWEAIISFYDVQYSGEIAPACQDTRFEKYTWFENVQLNFAENLLHKGDANQLALNFVHESGLKRQLSYAQLKSQVSRLSQSLKSLIKTGDVLAAYMPNIPETTISMLAASTLGAVFTSTSSDFGVEGVVDRFEQSKPKVLVAAIGYDYNGKYFDLTEKLKQIEARLPQLEKLILVDFLGKGIKLDGFKKAVAWDQFLAATEVPLEFVRVKFSAPLYIMYSSGTTGKPKCIVHSVGGTLLQHLKELGLHSDLTAKKNIFYFTTCGWMMWNWLMSSLAFGATLTLYEGSPAYPSTGEFLKIIERERIHIFGTSPKFLRALEDSGWQHGPSFDTLETILSTGSPLLPEQFDFVYREIKSDVQLASICGGTDIIGCFMLGNPILPVRRGEIQCLGLGMDVACVDSKGQALIGSEGELVCRQSFPSRPIYFLNDQDNAKIRAAYFNQFPNTWYHGDYVQINETGGVQVHGRSDATLNPGGVRIGTAEIYRQTEGLPYLMDSLCVGKNRDGDVDVILFVKLQPQEVLSSERIAELKQRIKANTTARHVPKEIHQVADIPYTRSGKKMELAIMQILNKKPLSNIEAVANPECLKEYEQFAQ